MNRLAQIILLITCCLILVGFATSPQTSNKEIHLYVSLEGNDQWSGLYPEAVGDQSDGPFATLERAVKEARLQRGTSNNADKTIVINIREGIYPILETVQLTERDSGREYAPLIIRAYKNEEVRLIGGLEIDQFQPVLGDPIQERFPADIREHVVQVDLKQADLDNPSSSTIRNDSNIGDFGELQPRGFGRTMYPAALELFYDQKPMTLARWPNEGWLNIDEVPQGQKGGVFTYDGERHRQWEQREDIWVHGLWYRDWADSYEKVRSIDDFNNEIRTYEPHGVYGYKEDQRFYFLNVLDELDQPGEWYLDRDTGILYFWPPEATKEDRAFVSIIESPILSIENTQHLIIENLTFEFTRGKAIEMNGGSHNLIAGCTLRNTGNNAIDINGGERNGVRSCDIYQTGDGGIILSGGDRQTLTPAHHYVENNHFYDFSRWVLTYRPAVRMRGVGNRLANNLIHDAPHCGVLFSGNEHVLEYNEVYNLCYHTGDVGAFYIGRDWTQRGNVVRYNYFHDIHGPYTHGAMSVYLDDAICGTTIFGNVFYKASRAAFVGGGRDNLIENNIFVECNPSVHIDARALGWAKEYAEPGGGWRMYEKLDRVNHDEYPYSVRYPKLATILENDPAYPLGNKVIRNISVDGEWLNLQNVERDWVEIKDNWVDKDPGFIDKENHNFQLRSNSPVYELGFQRIPIEKIGLYKDRHRVILPPPQTYVKE